MDSAIAVDRRKRSGPGGEFFDVKEGDEIVVGRSRHPGRSRAEIDRAHGYFSIINTTVDADEPKSAVIREPVRNGDARGKRKARLP